MNPKSRIVSAIVALAFLPAVLSAQNVTLSMHQARLGDVLDAIEQQTGCVINYTQPPVDPTVKVSVDVKDLGLKATLEKIFEGKDIDVQVVEKKVYLKAKAKTPAPAAAPAGNVYKGVVLDTDGEPVFGAGVLIQGTTNGSMTDLDGNFSISSPKGTVVEVSALGYRTETITLGDKQTLRVVLALDVTQLDDVVVVGYTTRSREKLISSVSTMNGTELVKADVPNLENALSGKVSGVFSRQTSGEPGRDEANLTIRGFGSALVVVDGIPGRSYSDLDPNEIESISVLKDASASAVYGMQGANGVILVTTKRGARNKPVHVDATAKYTLQQASRYPKTAGSELYQTLLAEYNINRQILSNRLAVATADQMAPVKTAYDTDWTKEMFSLAPSTQANLNISGGSEKINYFVSGGYLYQGGLWSTKSTDKNRFNMRSNIDADLAEGLKASVSVGAVIADMDYPYSYSQNIARQIQKASPLMPVKWNSADEFYAFNGEGTANPMAMADADASGYKNESEKSFTIDASLEYKLPWVEGLSVKANLGYSFDNTYARSWAKEIGYIGYYSGSDEFYKSKSHDYSDKADLTVSNSDYSDMVFQGFLNYNRTFNSEHTVNAGLVYELNSATRRYFYTTRTAYPSTITDRLYAGLSGPNYDDGETFRKYHSVSVVERFSYDYKSRYFIDVNTRLDGAQYFSRKWGLFPSVSLGWMMTNEPFMEGHKGTVKELKLRASYGTLGDLSVAKAYYDSYEMYYYQAGYKYPGSEMKFGDRTLLSLEQTINANKDFTWSTSSIANLGVDFKLFSDNLLSGNIDVFYRSRKGLPAMMANDNAGALATYYNINSDNTRGVELSLNHAGRIGEFSYSAGLNFSWSRTKNGHVETTEYPSGYSDWRNNLTGRWSNIRWGYHCIGRYESWEDISTAPIHINSNGNANILPGDLKYEDVNGDGYIDTKDMMPIGRTAYPEMMFGLNLTAAWRNWDMAVFLQGAALCEFCISNYDQYAFENGRTTDNCWAYFADRWHKEDYSDPNSRWIPGYFPAIRDWADESINKYASDFWMFNGTYVRVKNIELGYNFKLKTKNNSSFRVYAAGYNPFTIASQPYFDPEIPDGASLTFAAYPQLRSYIVGINFKF